MKKASAQPIDDDLRPEYDLAELKGGVRGKYYKRASVSKKRLKQPKQTAGKRGRVATSR